jgi:hypothetical protein
VNKLFLTFGNLQILVGTFVPNLKNMSKFNETVDSLKAEMKKLGISFNDDLFVKVTKGCGPSIYNNDARTVSCSDPSELATVKNNFLIKKMGLEDSPKLDEAIKSVCEKMGSSNRNKYRAIFYYLLVEHFKLASKY